MLLWVANAAVSVEFADAAAKNTGTVEQLINPFIENTTGETEPYTIYNPEGEGTNYAFSDFFAYNTSSGDLRATMAYYSLDHDNNNGGGDSQNIVSQQDQTPTITASADITIA